MSGQVTRRETHPPLHEGARTFPVSDATTGVDPPRLDALTYLTADF